MWPELQGRSYSRLRGWLNVIIKRVMKNKLMAENVKELRKTTLVPLTEIKHKRGGRKAYHHFIVFSLPGFTVTDRPPLVVLRAMPVNGGTNHSGRLPAAARESLPRPTRRCGAGVRRISPWVDLSDFSSETWQTNGYVCGGMWGGMLRCHEMCGRAGLTGYTGVLPFTDIAILWTVSALTLTALSWPATLREGARCCRRCWKWSQTKLPSYQFTHRA